MKLNNRQQSLLNIHITKSIAEGNASDASGRELQPGEFKPCLANAESGAIWSKTGIPSEVNPGFVFMPVVNDQGKESLGLFLHGSKGNALPMALIEPDAAPGLISDLMMSAAQYSDATILAEVSKRVQDVVLACDLPIKKQLMAHSEEALEAAMAQLVEKRVAAKTKHFEATVDSIEARAELKMARVFASKLAELASIAVTPDDFERKLKMDSIMPEVKRILEVATK
jgi:hypothetical protein